MFALVGSAYSQDAEKKIDAKAKEVLDAAAAVLGSAKTLQVESKFQVNITPPAGLGAPPQEDEANQKLSLARPDQMSIVTTSVTGRQQKVSAYYNKGQADLLFGDGDGIVQTKGLKSIGETFTNEDLGYQPQAKTNVFLDQNMTLKLIRDMALDSKTWDKDVVALAYGGEKEVDGKKVHQITLTQNTAAFGKPMSVPIAIEVASGEKPMITKMSPDLTELVKTIESQNPQAKGVKMEMVGTFSNWKIAEPIPASDLAAPAAGETKVYASISEFFQAMQGGGRPDPARDPGWKRCPGGEA